MSYEVPSHYALILGIDSGTWHNTTLKESFTNYLDFDSLGMIYYTRYPLLKVLYLIQEKKCL